jgi:predicted 3-demethylubiquinone-9 3-methyltransferase (glyoxalase superfamily)
MQKITPFLWFDGEAEEAFAFYASLFKNAKVTDVTRYPEGSPVFPGKVMSATLHIGDQQFYALNAGPQFKFTEAISLFINAEDQAEVDHFYDKLSAGGEAQPCGWVKDKFGLSWQVVPPILGRYLGDKDQAKAGRVMQAMMGMHKIIIKDLQKAYDGK